MRYRYLDSYLNGLPYLRALSDLELVYFIKISMDYSEVQNNLAAKKEFQDILGELFKRIEIENSQNFIRIKNFYDNAIDNNPETAVSFANEVLKKVNLLSKTFNVKYAIINQERSF